jgi:hypothetical protein
MTSMQTLSSPGVQESDDQVGSALYELLYGIEGLHVAVDGWEWFRIVRESADSMDVVGLMTLLPTGDVPIEINVRAAGQALNWSVQRLSLCKRRTGYAAMELGPPVSGLSARGK